MEEMMVSRRAVLQSQAEKVSRNWAEESGMRQFIAVSVLDHDEKTCSNVVLCRIRHFWKLRDQVNR